jgi:hypothetical protein
MPDHMTSPVWWREVLRDKTSSEAAQQIIGNLIGYRSTSIHRAADHDAMTAALHAVAYLARDSGWPKERKPGL